MRIVFGWNNFRIKSYTPFELGLTTDPLADFTIEVRQSYFHLFWIPFFGLGKTWAIRKNGKLYELPAVYQAQIHRANLSHRTPWYTFAGPLLIIFGFISFVLYQKYDDYRNYTFSKKSHEATMSLLQSRLSQKDTNDYYRLECNECYGENAILLKVRKIKKNGVLFSRIVTPFKGYELNRFKLHDIIQSQRSSDDSVYITNELLTRTAIREFNDVTNKGQDIFGDQKLYYISEIYRVDGPHLEKNGSAGMSAGGYLSFNLTNSDMEADLVSVKNIEGNFKWDVPTPQHLYASRDRWDQVNVLKMTCNNYQFGDLYKVELLLKDSIGKEYKFLVEGTNLDTKVRRIN